MILVVINGNKLQKKLMITISLLIWIVYTLESVLRKGAELVKRKGIKCLVIDPYNKVRDVDCKTEDVNRYTMEYLN